MSRQVRRLIWMFILAAVSPFWSLVASASEEGPKPVGRHLYLIRPSMDRLDGSYVFGLKNESDQPQRTVLEVMLPAGVIDWRPEEGIDPSELRLGENGGLVLDKELPPGVTLIVIGFTVAASNGKAALTFTPKYDLEQISVLTPKGAVKVSAEGFEPSEDMQFGPTIYQQLTAMGIASETKISVLISGLPRGRAALWASGGMVAGLLFLCSWILAVRTRPRMAGGGSDKMHFVD